MTERVRPRPKVPVVSIGHQPSFISHPPPKGSALSESPEEPAPGIEPRAARAVWVGLAVLILGAVLALTLLRKPAEPPPPDVARDPLLRAGREVYLDRCVSCHGSKGKGDGPIARGLSGPPVGDLSDARWKHGDRPEQVRAVIADGVKSAAMPGWKGSLTPDQIDAVSAYVYYLAGREVPPDLRAPGSGPAPRQPAG
jgi:cytochrome c oxidase cbb3-type subunit 3